MGGDTLASLLLPSQEEDMLTFPSRMSQSVMCMVKKTNAEKRKIIFITKTIWVTNTNYLCILIVPYLPTDDHLIPLVSPTSYPQNDPSHGEQ